MHSEEYLRMLTLLLSKSMNRVWLLPLLIVLTSCGSKDDDKPEPKPQYVVKVRMITTDASGLGPGGEVYMLRLNQPKQLLTGTALPDNGTIETSEITNLQTGEAVSIGLGFDKATKGSGIVPRTTSKIRGEIWVNDQLKASAELDRNTPSGNPEYPTTNARYTMGD